MAHRRVPGAAAVEVGAPRDRVVVVDRVAVLLVVGGLVDRGEDVHLAWRAGCSRRRSPLPFTTGSVMSWKLYHSSVRVQEAGRPVVEGSSPSVDVDVGGRRSGRVAAEVAADQLAVPGPRVLRVGRGVDAGEAAAALDVALERLLLGDVEDVTGRREEGDDVVLREVRVGERGGVLGRGDGEVVGGAELLDRRMPCGIESWRKPPVLENTSTFSSGSASSTVTVPVMPGVDRAQERVGARVRRTCASPAERPAGATSSLSVQLALVEWTSWLTSASSNSHSHRLAGVDP